MEGEEGATGRKSDSSTRPNLFESKTEKKRKLILSDSEEEEEEHRVDNENARLGHPRDSEEVAVVVKKRASKWDVKAMEVAGSEGMEVSESDEAKVLIPDAVNRKEEAGIDAGLVNAGVGFEKCASSSDIVKQRDDFGTNAKGVIELVSEKGEVEFNAERPLSSDVINKKDGVCLNENGGSSVVEETSDLQQGKGKEEIRVARKRVSRWDVMPTKEAGEKGVLSSSVTQKEEADSNERKVTGSGLDKDEIEFNKRALSSDVAQKEDADTNTRKVTELGTERKESIFDKKLPSCSNIVKSKGKTFTGEKKLIGLGLERDEDEFDKWASSGVKKREHVRIDRKKVAVSGSEKRDLNYEKKRALTSDTLKKSNEASNGMKKVPESGSRREGLKFDRKQPTRTDIKEREETTTGKKKVAEQRDLKSDKSDLRLDEQREEAGTSRKSFESGVVSKLDRKRSRETPDAEISLKKTKTGSLKLGRDESKEIDRKKMGMSSPKQTDKGTESKVDRIPGSKSVNPADKLDKSSKLEGEERKSTDHSGPKREDTGSSQRKDIRVQGKGGILTVLPSNKKVGGLEKVDNLRKGEEQMKSSTPTNAANQKREKTPSLSGERNVAEKLSSTVALGKRKIRRSSSGEKHDSHEVNADPETKISVTGKPKGPKSHEAKIDRKSSSQKSELEMIVLHSKSDAIVKGGSESTSKALSSSKQNKEASGNLLTVKQKAREQIKEVLLSCGWKIDLRPRRGRAYEDQVYIPPTGGGGYWSITKAYDKYLQSQKEDGTSSPSVIPSELLNMLKRNVVNKRRRAEDAQTKGSRKKNLKKTAKKSKMPGGISGEKKLGNSKAEGDIASSSQNLRHLSGKKNKGQSGCALLVRDANQEVDTEYDDYVPYLWKRTVFSWMIDLGIVSANAKVKYMNKKRTRSVLEGRITRNGIDCGCCSKILSVLKFEIHAGSKLQQPYENIFVQDSGLSLLQCQLNAWEKQESERRVFHTLKAEGDDPNDDTCGICGDGGDLICCDGCPSTFHQSCLGFEILPSGDWHCSYCSCRYCGLAVTDSTQESEVPSSPLLSCSQCEEKYHQECIPEAEAFSVSSNSSRTSFCGQSCKKVFRQLKKLLGVKNDLEAGFSWRLIRRLHEDSPRFPCTVSQRAECNAKIAVALLVMDECFLPIIDQRSGINLVHNVVYNCGSNINRLNYDGFFTFILERGDEIISAASIRIHGTRMAEMPFIGTRNMYRRQGMCRRLLNGIETAFRSFGIKKLIIPAISELAETWTTVFGFKALGASQKQEVKSINMLVFPYTGLLQKRLLKKDPAEQHVATNEADKIVPGIEHHNTNNEVAESFALSSGCPDTHEVKYEEPCLTPLSDHPHSTTNVAPESLNASHGSEFQDVEEACCHSLKASETISRSKDIMHDNQSADIDESGVVLALNHVVDNDTAQITAEAKCNSLQCNSEIITGSMDPSTNTLLTTSGEFNTHAASEAAVQASIHEGKADSVEQKPDGQGKSPSDGHCVDCVSDIITGLVCAASGDACRVSITEKLTQKGPEIVDEPPEFHGENFQHNQHGSVDSSHLHLPDSNDKSNGDVLRTHGTYTAGLASHETNNRFCSVEPNVVCESSDVFCYPTTISSGADPGNSQTLDSDNCNLEMVTKDSAPPVIGASKFCASVKNVQGATNIESFENASSEYNHGAVEKSAEGISDLDGSGSAILGGPLGTLVELNLASTVVGSDTNISKDEVAVREPAESSGRSSLQ